MNSFKATLQTKNGMYYCVISYKDSTGKWKLKWKTTKVLAKQGNKKKAKDTFPQIIADFEKELEQKETKEKEDKNSYERRIESYKNTPFTIFIAESIEEFKNHIEETTYDNWKGIISKRINNYFKPYKTLTKIFNEDVKRPIYYDRELTISEISQFDIEDFYKWLYDCGLKGSSVAKYHVLLSLICKRAIRLKVFTLETNPMKDVQKPKIEPYTADYFSAEELNIVFELVKGKPIEMPVIFAAYYGLRRSEALGIKWSAIDFQNKYIIIKHTVTKVIGRGENQEIHSKEFTKNNDIRVLPLIPAVEQKLLEHKEKIKENKKFYGNAYIKNAEEYVCVNEIGELVRPNYVTHAFGDILKDNSDKIRKIKYHGLRHSCASILAQQNVSLPQIQQYIGHKNIRSTSIYMHVNYNSQIFSANVISEQLAKASGQ